jgi:hypothetical protein
MPLTLLLAACAPQWHYEYDPAIRQARRYDKDVLVFYKDPMGPASSRVLEHLRSPELQPLLEDKVRCTLVPFYAPNRKFTAQYGVFEPPALIVIHPDTTYHALPGLKTPAEIREFITKARPPGERPNLNPGIPTRGGFEYFNTLEPAVEKARRQNRPLFIIYKWWLDPNSTELIRRVSRPDVAEYFSRTVNCILDWDFVPNRAQVAKYGVNDYPAMILIYPDGAVRTLNGLPSVEQVIRFVTQPTP